MLPRPQVMSGRPAKQEKKPTHMCLSAVSEPPLT